jgi:hypothetical protein
MMAERGAGRKKNLMATKGAQSLFTTLNIMLIINCVTYCVSASGYAFRATINEYDISPIISHFGGTSAV